MSTPGGYPPYQPYQPPQQPPGYPGYPGHPGYPAGPPRPAGTNGFAVASLVLSLLCTFPLGLIFGVIALVQTRDGRQGGRAMAIAGVVISSVVTVGMIGVIVSVLFARSPDHDSASGTTGPSSRSHSSELHLSVGDCITALPDSSRIFSVPTVACSQPHRGEVVAVLTVPGSTYPGEDSMKDFANNCADAFDDYSPRLAGDTSYDLYYIYPTAGTWKDGDRDFVCIATTEDLRSGSVR